jgi:hypothetical protein
MRTLSMMSLILIAACNGPNDPRSGQHGLGNNGQTCSSGKDCPIDQGCASDGTCHADGQCNADSDCNTGELCYPGLAGTSAGICASARPSVDPYCRSDGQGACRALCNSDGNCGSFNHCVNGFCHFGDECATQSDCGPNSTCEPRLGDPQYGVSECVPQSMPTCVSTPDGACRLRCGNDNDCLNGGGCGMDGFCHASNECKANSDCPSGQICYPSTDFGGLCGPSRS